jgi:citrate lyase subunit beta / citryl-CoA lyase
VTRARRSLHFVPGASSRMIGKALASSADGLILDLEDSVPLDAKESARAEVARWLAELDFGAKERIVRINALDTPLAQADLAATLPKRPDAYLVPKVNGPEDLAALDAMLAALEREHGLAERSVPLIPIATETPQGLLRIAEIARAPRVTALTWGAEDLSAALGARASRDAEGRYLDVFRHARVMALVAAAAAGVDAIDGVYVDIRDLDGLAREAHDAAQQGFAGKMTLHPDQIPVVNGAFTPSQDEIAESRALLEAFEQERAAGRLAFRFRGRMVDAPHLARARRLLARASHTVSS